MHRIKKKLLTILGLFFIVNLYAQHWSVLMDQPNPNYFEVKTAFEKEWEGKSKEKGQGYSLFKRWELFMLKHMNKEGYYYAKPSKRNTISNDKLSARASTENWTRLGPIMAPLPTTRLDGNEGIGRVADVGFHPTDTLIFYVGAETGGLWKTTDGGNSYTFLSLEWSSNGIKNIHVNPDNPNEIYVNTVADVMHTIDAGISWEVLSTPSTSAVFLPLFDQGILLTTDFFIGYYSVDNGLSWEKITGFGFDAIKEFKRHPTDVNKVYASLANGLYLSSDGGKNFTLLRATGLTIGNTIVRLAVSPDEPNSLWALSVMNSRLGGVYKSLDGGENFIQILEDTDIIESNSAATVTGDKQFGGQGWIHRTIAVSPEDANIIMVGGVHTFYTLDSGNEWIDGSQSDGFLGLNIHADNLNMSFQPVSNKLFASNDGGVYKQRNLFTAGENLLWEAKNNTLAITQVYDASISNNGEKIIIGTQDNGSFLYDRTTAHWQKISGGDGIENGFDPVNNDVLYTTSQNGSISKSLDGGMSFSSVDLPGTVKNETSSFLTKMKVHPVKEGVFYHLRENLWVSENEVWRNLTASITTSLASSEFTISHRNPNLMSIRSSFNSAVYLSQDAGESWNQMTNLPRNGFIENICLHSSNPEILWVVSSGTLYETLNGGTTWESYEGWGDYDINQINHVDGTQNELLITTLEGVFSKAENETVFMELGSGLPVVSILDIEIDYCNERLFIATFGQGVWEIDFDLPNETCCRQKAEQIEGAEFICSETTTNLAVRDLSDTYTWTRNGEILSETSSRLEIDDNGIYQVTGVKNGCENPVLTIPVLGTNNQIEAPYCYYSNVQIRKNSLISEMAVDTLFEFCDTLGGDILSWKIDNALNASSDTVKFILTEIDLNKISKGINLSFDLSTLISFNENEGTNLDVYVSNDCGVTFVPIASFDKFQLGVREEFFWEGAHSPNFCQNWRHFDIDLSEFRNEKILVEFRLSSISSLGQSFWGGNIYFDNFCINESNVITNVFSAKEEGTSISISPNPIWDYFTINSELDVNSIDLFNTNGQSFDVVEKRGLIDVSHLSTGNYIVRIGTDEGFKHVKIHKK